MMLQFQPACPKTVSCADGNMWRVPVASAAIPPHGLKSVNEKGVEYVWELKDK